MTAQLNHTIVWCKDKQKSSAFMAEMLGMPEPVPFLHFMVIAMENGVSLDFMEKEGTVSPQHYAFLVSDAEFDAGMAKIAEKGLTYWPDPARSRPGEINHHWGGRGVYFEDPDGHLIELITQPYGSEEDI